MSRLTLSGMQCCAFKEISGLEDLNDPKESMIDLCSQIWPTRRVEYGERNKPSAFYIFNGVVGLNEDSEEYDGYDLTDAIPEFAAFIKKNKLGMVVAGPTRYNRCNEPSHQIRGYIWAPSEKALWAWYQENREDKEEVKQAQKQDRYGFGVSNSYY